MWGLPENVAFLQEEHREVWGSEPDCQPERVPERAVLVEGGGQRAVSGQGRGGVARGFE